MEVTGGLHAPAALLPGTNWMDMSLGGPQSLSGRCEVEKNFLPSPGIEHRPSIP
jgi:hypothetical protein